MTTYLYLFLHLSDTLHFLRVVYRNLHRHYHVCNSDEGILGTLVSLNWCLSLVLVIERTLGLLPRQYYYLLRLHYGFFNVNISWALL